MLLLPARAVAKTCALVAEKSFSLSFPSSEATSISQYHQYQKMWTANMTLFPSAGMTIKNNQQTFKTIEHKEILWAQQGQTRLKHNIVKLKFVCATRVPVLARDLCKSTHGAKMRSCAQHVPNCANTCITLSTAFTCTLQMVKLCRTSRPRVKKFWPRPFYIQASNTSHGFLPHTNSWFIRVPLPPLTFCELSCKWLNFEGWSVLSMTLMMMMMIIIIIMMIKTNNEKVWNSCLTFCIARCPQFELNSQKE